MTYNFKDRLVEIMKERGYTPKQFERKSGISIRGIGGWKDGAYPRVDTLITIADELQVTLDDLVGMPNASGRAALRQAVADAKLAGCQTCKYGRVFNTGLKAVCARQGGMAYPQENLKCWVWRGWREK